MMSSSTDVPASRKGAPPEASSASGDDQSPLPADPNTLLLAGLLLFAALVAAYVAADVILPIVFAILLKFLLQPAMQFLTRLHIPRSLAAALLILAAFGGIIAIGAIVVNPARSWAAHLPEGLPRLEEKLRSLGDPIVKISALLHHDTKGEQSNIAALVSRLSSLGLTGVLFRGTQHFASGLFETILVLFFLLVSGDLFLRRFVEIMPRFKDKRQVVDLSQQIESNVSIYLMTITFMNAIVGIATTFIMWICGMGDPVLWGAVAFLLNFIPVMGPLFGIVIFLFVGLIAIPNVWQALLPAGLYFAVHVLEGETVTPMLLARRFTLNPVLIIISLIFWFWMWGVPGALLSVPMLATMKIICDGVTSLKPIGHFLEGEAAMARDS